MPLADYEVTGNFLEESMEAEEIIEDIEPADSSEVSKTELPVPAEISKGSWINTSNICLEILMFAFILISISFPERIPKNN